MVVVTIPILSAKADKLDLTGVMRDSMAAIKLNIQTRLNSGVDTQGRAFTPYAESTKAQRAKTGRSTSPVNLQFSGRMLRAIQARHTRLSGRLFIRAGRPEAAYGAAHQDGFSGTVNVSAHTRKQKSRDTFGKVSVLNEATGHDVMRRRKVSAGIATVKAHSRAMKLPKRRWWGADNATWRKVLRDVHREISKQLHVAAPTKQI